MHILQPLRYLVLGTQKSRYSKHAQKKKKKKKTGPPHHSSRHREMPISSNKVHEDPHNAESCLVTLVVQRMPDGRAGRPASLSGACLRDATGLNFRRHFFYYVVTALEECTPSSSITANVGTKGASKNFLFWDVFKELYVTQSVLHRFG
jgi:hypothetical protein